MSVMWNLWHGLRKKMSNACFFEYYFIYLQHRDKRPLRQVRMSVTLTKLMYNLSSFGEYYNTIL